MDRMQLKIFQSLKSLSFPLVLGMLIKACLFLYFCLFIWQLKNSWLIHYDDTQSYFTPIELWVQGEGYSRFGHAAYGEARILPFAGRMPGLLPVYAPLFALFGASTGQGFLLLFQVGLSTLAAFILGEIFQKIFGGRPLWKNLLIMLYLMSYQVHFYDHGAATESLSISASIFSLWYVLIFQERKNSRHLLFAGIFLAWGIFLRPIYGCLLPVWAMLIWGIDKSWNLAWIKRSFLLFLPFMLFLSAWTLRNAISMKQLIILEDRWENSYPHEPEYGPDGMAIRRLIKAWGGDVLFWVPESMGNTLLAPEPDLEIEAGLPRRIYTASYTTDSLQLLRNGYLQANKLTLHVSEQQYWEQKTIERAEAYLASFKRDHPWEYYLGSRLRLAAKFLLIPHPPDFPFPLHKEQSPGQYWLKAIYSLLPYLFLLAGLLAMPWGLGQKSIGIKGVSLFPLCMILTLVAGLGMIETRYLLPLWPWILMLSVWGIRQFRVSFFKLIQN